jgi:hypothetical protein
MPEELHTTSEWAAIKANEKAIKAHSFIQASIRLASDAMRMAPDLAPQLEPALSELVKAKHLAARRVR